MLTVKQIKAEAAAVREQARQAAYNEVKKYDRRLEFLKTCQYYLETTPRPEFIQDQLNIVERMLALTESRFADWARHKTGGRAELLRQWNQLNEVSKLKAQRKALRYLLGSEQKPAE